jgi:hypothetical protein
MSITLEETDTLMAYDVETGDSIFYNDDPDVGGNYYEGSLEIIPNFGKGFENYYVVSPSGGGKTTVALMIAMNYRRYYPNNRIIILTYSDENQGKKEKRIFTLPKNSKILKPEITIINDDFLEKEIDVVRDFKDCLVIFDDFLYGNNKKLTKKITDMVIQTLTLCRKNDVYCILTAHLIYSGTDASLYRTIHNEVHKLVWFKERNSHQLRYVLKEYWDIEPKIITQLLNFDKHSRWICLNKNPRYALSRNCVQLIK